MIKNLLPENTFWITEDWYIAQTERWDRLRAKWIFYIPPTKTGYIGIGMQNETHEAQFLIWNAGSVEQRHTALLLMCELFDAQSNLPESSKSNKLNKIRECIGLLISMVSSGEVHTSKSLEVIADAKTAISTIEMQIAAKDSFGD